MERQQKEFDKKIKQILEVIPGILGFESIAENDENSYIKYSFENKKMTISLGLIISRNVTTSTLSNEILDSIKFFLKKNSKKYDYSLSKVIIYIKGVK